MNQLTIFVLASIFYLATCASVRTIDFNFPVNGAKAVALLRGTFNKSQILGTITFQQFSANDNMRVKVNITGIPQGLGAKHGLHIHRDAITAASLDTAEVCGSAGPHFNPLNSTHGHASSSVRHVGDYGNVVSRNGVIMTEFVDRVSQLFGTFGIVGRTIVLHQLEDDLGLKNNTGSLTTGNAGARIACGVIGLVA